MEIAIEISGGQHDEVERVRNDLRGHHAMADAKIFHRPGAIEEGTLGVEQILQFVGDNVALPMLVQALYDYLTSRRRARSAANLRITLARTDLPDGTRRVELTLEGPASEVVEAVRKELE